VYPNDAPIPAGQEWYYELDGRSHGPISWADLEELLNRSGETALEVRVRQGADGPWTQFRSQSGAAGAARPGSTWETHLPAGESVPPSGSRSPVAGKDVRGLLRTYWDIAAALGVWILLNVSYLSFWPEPHSSERRYLQTLRAIETEVTQLRSKPTSDAEWHELSQRTKATLAPMVSDLKKSASSSEPLKQQLLWSARDLVPRTIGPRTKERDEEERRLKHYLDGAQRELESD
jgi:hypothetical protein